MPCFKIINTPCCLSREGWWDYQGNFKKYNRSIIVDNYRNLLIQYKNIKTTLYKVCVFCSSCWRIFQHISSPFSAMQRRSTIDVPILVECPWIRGGCLTGLSVTLHFLSHGCVQCEKLKWNAVHLII